MSSQHLTFIQSVESLAHGLGTPEPNSNFSLTLSPDAATHGVDSSSLTAVRSAVTPNSAPEFVNLAEELVLSTTSTSQRLGLVPRVVLPCNPALLPLSLDPRRHQWFHRPSRIERWVQSVLESPSIPSRHSRRTRLQMIRMTEEIKCD